MNKGHIVYQELSDEAKRANKSLKDLLNTMKRIPVINDKNVKFIKFHK